MRIDKENTIGNIVAEDYRTAAVFKKFGIDFCCGGGISVEAACKRKGLDVNRVMNELLSGQGDTSAPNLPFNKWKPAFLADYIVNVHHEYVREKSPVIQQFANKVAKVHGGRHPELIQVLAKVTELNNDLKEHMWKEERVLFPFIKQLEDAEYSGKELKAPAFGTVQNPVSMMEEEHDHAGTLMKEISDLTDGFTPPQDACTTYRVLFDMLADFENDLHQHVHLENNILFPKAIELEAKHHV